MFACRLRTVLFRRLLLLFLSPLWNLPDQGWDIRLRRDLGHQHLDLALALVGCSSQELVAVNPNRKIFAARKRETAALGAGEKLVLGHPLAATIGDSARCMQNLEKVLFTGPKTSDTVTFICD